jgi:hypothetical protein
MDESVFTRANLSDVRIIMTIMFILVDEWLCQTVTGQIPVIECLLSGACGWLCLHPVMPIIKWRCFLRTQV